MALRVGLGAATTDTGAGATLPRGELPGWKPMTPRRTKKPTTYATVTNQPWRSHWPAERASGYIVAIATPADEPNQIIEPPKPTA